MTVTRPVRIAAVVTGHSRGLGAAVAEHLLRRGVAVLGVSRHLTGHSARGFVETAVDLADDRRLHEWLASDPLEPFFRSAQQVLLVNNAGLLQPIGRLEQQDPVAVSRAVAVNVGAALALASAFARATSGADDRRILHVSSGAARKAYAGWSVYCATKAALDHHARAVVLDRSTRLRIESVAPGIIDTDMQTDIRATTDDRFPDRQRFVRLKEEGALQTPAQAAARLVEHLLSPDFGGAPVSETRR